jgi:hypothetical protein
LLPSCFREPPDLGAIRRIPAVRDRTQGRFVGLLGISRVGRRGQPEEQFVLVREVLLRFINEVPIIRDLIPQRWSSRSATSRSGISSTVATAFTASTVSRSARWSFATCSNEDEVNRTPAFASATRSISR